MGSEMATQKRPKSWRGTADRGEPWKSSRSATVSTDRALAKGTAWAGFYSETLLLLRLSRPCAHSSGLVGRAAAQ